MLGLRRWTEVGVAGCSLISGTGGSGSGCGNCMPLAMTTTTAAAAARGGRNENRGARSNAAAAGWPPGLSVYERFGAPTPDEATGFLDGVRALLAAVEAAAASGGDASSVPPRPVRSRAHNLAPAERSYAPLRVPDPGFAAATGSSSPPRLLRCEHFAAYSGDHHALTYFRGNENVPSACDPILAALRELEPIEEVAAGDDGSGLQWKLTLNHYRARDYAAHNAEAEADDGALFPWHTDLPSNGDVTAILTLLAPAVLEFAPREDSGVTETPTTRVVATPGSLVLLAGPARWEWAHRAMPHGRAAGRERVSLVFGCARRGGFGADPD